MSFKIKLSILFSLIFIFFSYLIYKYLTQKGEDYIKKELIERGNSICSSLSMVAKEPLIDENKAELSRLAYSLKKEENLSFVYIVNRKGIIKGAPDLEDLDKNIQEVLAFYKSGKDIMFFEKDIIYSNINIGKVYIGIPSIIVKKAKSDFRKGAIFIFSISLICGIIIIFTFTYLSLKPLNYIVSVLKRIGEGRLNEKIDIHSKDEFGKIEKAAEEMRQKLIEYQAEISRQERLKRDAELAREIQKMLLPEKLPELRGYEITHYYEPAFYVGGDYCDVLKTLTHTLCVIGDVSGKGASSSLIMALTKAFIYSNYKTSRNPVAFVTNLHSFIKHRIPDDMFITLFLLYLEENGTYLYSSCGHTSPFLFVASEEKLLKFKMNGVPVGFSFVSDNEYPSYVQKGNGKLEKGDILFLYTDGLFDVKNEKGEFLGEERFFDFLNQTVKKEGDIDKIKENIVKMIQEFRGEAEPEDDITFMIIKKT